MNEFYWVISSSAIHNVVITLSNLEEHSLKSLLELQTSQSSSLLHRLMMSQWLPVTATQRRSYQSRTGWRIIYKETPAKWSGAGDSALIFCLGCSRTYFTVSLRSSTKVKVSYSTVCMCTKWNCSCSWVLLPLGTQNTFSHWRSGLRHCVWTKQDSPILSMLLMKIK